MGKALTSLADLTSDPRNARRHNPRNVGMIEKALNEVGAARSIVVDENNVVLAGNATIEAAAQAGIERVQVIDADGETLIAVRRSGLTDEQKARLALYDNRTAELAEWDASVLAELAQETDLSGLFNDDELAALLAETAIEPGAGGDEFDPTPEDGPTRAQPGDLWVIGGKHRLIVGDCTDAAVVGRLMDGERAGATITDPPYNVGLEYGESTDDDKSIDDYTGFLRTWFWIAREHTHGSVVVTPGMVSVPIWIADIERTHYLLAWVKENNMSRNYIGKTSGYQCWEPVLVYGKSHTTILRDTYNFPITMQKGVGDHPCPKPLGLWQKLVGDFTEKSDVVLDPFLGSGTTIIAAHRTGRRCYGVEIEPRYADVILRRCEAEGLTCERLPTIHS